MSRMKKLLVGLIITLIGIFGIHSMSNAYYVGQYITVTYNQYANSNNIFCMEHGQSLTADNYYKIISNVKIDGTKSTDHNGKTIDNKANAKLAYILNAAKTNYRSTIENAVWNYGHVWMKNVGKNHNGLYEGFASNVEGYYSTSVETAAENYANNLASEKTAPEDKTDKDKIKVQSYQKDNKQYIRVGAFKWDFGGKLTEMTVYDQNNNKIDNILYSKIEKNEEKFVDVADIASGKRFYISIPADQGVSKITKITAKENIDNITANIWFLESTAGYKQNLLLCSTNKGTNKIEMSFDYNILLQGNLKVIKVNKDNETIKLQGVGFVIQNKDTKKYVVRDENKIIKYVDNREDAEEFMTDRNGEISIENLLVGTYVAYETQNNPNYGYEILSEGKEKQVVVDKTAELKIPNKQIYVKLSGYVWVDKISEKQSVRNDLYNDGDYDPNDTLLDGITVKLKNRETGEVVKEAKTANGGAYKFVNVLIEDLNKYYIEFEYDGLTYTNVVAHTDKDNGSKSAENSDTRTNFNNNFAVVEGKTSNTSITRDTAGNEKHTITYYDISENVSTVDRTKSYYEITANTDETGYKIKDHFTYGDEEIKYINLGLYEREMPDIRLEKDVENVELSINGYNHVYEYGSKKLDNYTMKKDSNNFNVGVEFPSKYTGTYQRAIYEPDYNYTLENQDKDSKLNVYLTYRIAMYNESTTLKVKVNSIVDYFDKNFTIEKIGTGINKETGEITGNITIPQVEQDEGYNKVIIQNNTEIEAEKQESIYVRFKLSDQEVLNAINEKDKMTYKNVAEVNSYSVFKDGKVYAGIDKDSAPANTTPGDITTYEDDTNRAPGIQLKVEGNRALSGSVFLDDSTGGVDQVRLGDGIYDTSKEHGIAGIKVTLKENKENGEIRTAITDENGNFTITDFIPGDYTLTYTWGDETYSVKNYKGTIWTENNRTEKERNGSNWYKVNIDTRYSDAMDDYNTRQKIDAGEDIATMDSTTPTMALNVEVNSVYSIVPDVDRFVAEGYEIRNVDFGIVERARQQLDIAKQVKTFKVTLANGQVIVDAEIDDNGNLVGSTNNVIYMKPGTTNPSNGQIWLQLDNELIQGAKVQVGYEIKVSNNSELDYDTERYYFYGTDRNNVITITPTGVYDYLDGMVMDPEKDNTGWEVISKEEYNNNYSGPTIVEEYFLSEANSTTDENGNTVNISRFEVSSQIYQEIYTDWAYSVAEGRTVRDEKLSNKTILHNADLEKEIEPGKSNVVTLNTATTLANSDEIDLNNDAEITEFKKNRQAGGTITPRTSSFFDRAQEITVTPPTGENSNYILIIATVVVALVILGVGVILIKKKTL